MFIVNTYIRLSGFLRRTKKEKDYPSSDCPSQKEFYDQKEESHIRISLDEFIVIIFSGYLPELKFLRIYRLSPSFKGRSKVSHE